jgi:hypothetical protein
VLRTESGRFPKSGIAAVAIAGGGTEKISVMVFMTAGNEAMKTNAGIFETAAIYTSTGDGIVLPGNLARGDFMI